MINFSKTVSNTIYTMYVQLISRVTVTIIPTLITCYCVTWAGWAGSMSQCSHGAEMPGPSP